MNLPAYCRPTSSNAFCRLDRQAAFDAIQRLVGDAPWLPFVHQLLEQPLHIAVPTWADSHDTIFVSSSGIGQGDPLSSLLFAAVVTEALQAFHRKPQIAASTLRSVAYIDDCVLAGKPADLARALPLLAQHLATYGLELAQQKCKVYGRDRAAFHPHDALVGLLPAEGEPLGIVICGHALSCSFEDELPVPLGSTAFQKQWLQHKLVACQDFIAKLSALPQQAPPGSPALQVAFQLLNQLLPAKIMHILRSVARSSWAEWAETLQQEVQRLLRQWLDLQQLEACQLAVATIPAMRGGLGFVNIPLLGLTARAAALFSLEKQSPSAPAITSWVREEKDELYGMLQPLMRAPVAAVLGDNLAPEEGCSRKAAQRRLRKHIDRTSVQMLLNSYSSTTSLLGWQLQRHNHGQEAGLPQHQPLRSAWLKCWPTSTALALSDEDWCWGVRQRLGIPAAALGIMQTLSNAWGVRYSVK